jgi:NADH:ubiquinone reductase (H+-translocating)
MPEKISKHRVVIVGGGFGGLYAAKVLQKKEAVHTTLIDRRNFHLFQPLLYQVATGGLSAGDIAYPLRAVFRNRPNMLMLMGEVVDVDMDRHVVILNDGETPYESLIVATGSTHHYFGNNHWEQFAPGLKTIEDSTEIRRRILLAFEAAEREPDPAVRREWLTFVVVGAGPTGVELAGTLGEIANDTLKGDFRLIDPSEARIILMDAAARVLPPYDPKLSASAERALIQLGVRTRVKLKLTNVDERGVDVETEAGEKERIAARTVLWAAGVTASPLARLLGEKTGAEIDRMGRVTVEPDLTLPNHPDVFVIGDMAMVAGDDGKPLPGVAPVAMQQGRYAAKQILARLKNQSLPPFEYRDRGSMATIGKAAAVAQFGRVKLDGFIAWLVWLFIHLMYLVGFQNRALVLFTWAFHYMTAQRRARLITGESPFPLIQSARDEVAAGKRAEEPTWKDGSGKYQ